MAITTHTCSMQDLVKYDAVAATSAGADQPEYIMIDRHGNRITLLELRTDIAAVRERAWLHGDTQFTADAVEMLVDHIEHLVAEVQRLRGPK